MAVLFVPSLWQQAAVGKENTLMYSSLSLLSAAGLQTFQSDIYSSDVTLKFNLMSLDLNILDICFIFNHVFSTWLLKSFIITFLHLYSHIFCSMEILHAKHMII